MIWDWSLVVISWTVCVIGLGAKRTFEWLDKLLWRDHVVTSCTHIDRM